MNSNKPGGSPALLNSATLLAGLLLFLASPTASAGMSASPNPSTTGDYTVSWTPVGDPQSYQLYESTNGGATWGFPMSVSTATPWKDFTGKPVATYTYKLYSCYTWFPPGSPVMEFQCGYINGTTTVQVTAPPPPPKPTGLKHPAVDFDGTYSISWNGASGATYYQLRERRWDSAPDPWQTFNVGSATTKSVTHSNGAWQYQVRACNSSGCSQYAPIQGVTVVSTTSTLYNEPGIGSASRAGKTDFSAFVDAKGNSRLDFPIRVPVGINDLALPLSLSYSSGAVPAQDEQDLPPSVIGHGWNLTGMPEIRACEVNGSGYCLNGTKLVVVSGSGSTTQYRTELNTFTKVTTESLTGHGTYLKAHLPDGRTMTFGKTPDSRVQEFPASTVLSWKLDEITDPFGNQVILTWKKIPEFSSSVITKISYGGAEIHFRYKNRCPSSTNCDMPNSNGVGIAGAVAQPLALNRILTRVEGKWVNDYRLDTNFDADGYLRLVRLQHCARDETGTVTKCMAATNFGWEKLGIFDSSDSSTSDLLVVNTVTDGYGDVYTFDYEVINGSGEHHVLGFAPPPALPDNALPSNVAYSTQQRALVNTLDMPDGSGGTARQKYRYNGFPLYDQNGRGYVGFPVVSVTREAQPQFNSSTETIWDANVRNVYQFRLDFPYIGLVGRSLVQVQIEESGFPHRTISRTLNRYSDQVSHSGSVHFPHLEYSLTERQEVTAEGSLGYGSASRVSVNYCWRALSGGACPLSGTTFEFPTRLATTTESGLYIFGTDDDDGTYGHVSTAAILHGKTHTSSSVIDYENVTSSWVLGFVTRSEVGWGTTSITETAETEITRTSTAHNKPFSVRFFPGDPEYDRTLTYDYDAYGNVLSVADTGVEQDSATTSYSSFLTARYPQSFTNPANNASTLGYDLRFGTVDSVTDPNSDVTTISRDEFGRATQTVSPDGTTVTTSYASCATGCGAVTWATPRLKITRTYLNNGVQVSPDEVAYLDARGLTVLTETEAFSATDGWVRVQLHYDRWGRLTKRSLPYFSVGGTPKYIEYFYDFKGRAVHVSRPNGESIERKIYADAGTGGHVTIDVTETGEDRTKRYRFNRLGQLAETTDGLGTTEAASTSYTYTVRGDLQTIVVDGDQVATIGYDSAGNRGYLTESNSGTSEFLYYSNHLLKQSTDANANTIRYEYDALGRLEQRTDGFSSASAITNVWTWDTAINGIGRLASQVSGPNAPGSPEFSQSYTYDAVGRLDTISTSINVAGFNDSSNYLIDYDFDTSGRLATIKYPNLAVTNHYTPLGYLSEVRKGSLVLHKYTNVDAFGNIVGEEYGNGLQTARTYDANTGELLTIQTGTPSLPKAIQDLVYDWQTDGALYQRIDKQGTSITSDDLTETFGYDGVGRLKSAGTASTGRDLTFSYDNHGNLLSKLSDVSGDLDLSGYSYTTSGKPHRLNSVTIGGISNSLLYDLAGNITRYNASSGDDTYIDYDKGNRVAKITVGSSPTDTTPTARDQFWYGPGGQRFLRKATWMNGSTLKESWTLYLLGGLFEENHPMHDTSIVFTQRVLVTGNVQHRYVQHSSSATTSIDYIHRDHLGSITAMTQGSGSIVEQVDFDPFGRQREVDWASDIVSAKLEDLAQKEESHTGRGFTDHEMLNRTGFTHMNGRVFDPRLGRFVQPDPIVGNPTVGDSYNRYSYVLNSPLSATDPTGFTKRDDDSFSFSITFGFYTPGIYTLSSGKHRPAGAASGGRREKSALESLPDLIGAAVDIYGCVRYGLCAGASSGMIPGFPGAGGFGTGICGELGGGSYCMSFDWQVSEKDGDDGSTEKEIFDVKGSLGVQVALGAGVKGILGIAGRANAAGYEYDFNDGSLLKTVEFSIAAEMPFVTLVEGEIRAEVPVGDLSGRRVLETLEGDGDIFVPHKDDFILGFEAALIWGIHVELNLSELGREFIRNVPTYRYPWAYGYPWVR